MSFINSIAKSMNGIKTIETTELIFTDDNSTLNTSAGINQAQSTGQDALNKTISATAFNTGTGVLTLTTQGSGVADLTQNLDGRYLTSGSGLVDTTSNQSIAGVKTFTDQPKATGTINDVKHLITKEYADAEYVKDTGTQSIAGEKTFTDQPKATGTINNDNHLITKIYADTEYVKDTGSGNIAGVKTFTNFPAKSGSGNDLNPTSDEQFTTKKYVDDSSVSVGSNNNFTGTNTFSSPPVSANNPTQSNQLANKSYVDIQATSSAKFLQFEYASSNANNGRLVDTAQGVPVNTNPNQFGGELYELKPELTMLSNTSSVIIDVNIMGGLHPSNDVHSKTMILVRTDRDSTPSANSRKVLYGHLQTNLQAKQPSMSMTPPIRVGFVLSVWNFRFVDDMTGINNTSRSTGAGVGDRVNYSPLMVNGGSTTNSRFIINRTWSGSNTSRFQRGCSHITLTEVEV